MPDASPHGWCTGCDHAMPLDAELRIVSHRTTDNIGDDRECTVFGGRNPLPPRLTFLADPTNPQRPAHDGPDPTVEFVTAAQLGSPHAHAEALERGRKAMAEKIPAHYAEAVLDVPGVAAWVRTLVRSIDTDQRTVPHLDRGRSLLILGPTGTGKSHATYGALRALSVCGVPTAWTFTTAADLYARLRPRQGVDSEDEFAAFAQVPILAVDDLGAAKNSDWTEEVNYRLINHRYEHELPTLITSNVPVKELGTKLGARVASRLTEMADRVVLRGTDRRASKSAAS